VRRASIGFATLVLGLVAAFGYAQAPVPFINQPLVPDAVAPGGPDFTLTVNGTGFVSNSTVNWNGSPLATTFVSGSKLTATVPAADTATGSTGWVTVVNPAPGGGTSNTAFFTVTANVGDAVAFSLASSTPVGYALGAVAAGDLNGDGKLDLAVIDECTDPKSCEFGFPGVVDILLGDGKGNFSGAPAPEAGNEPDALAAGDFNRDGKLDLAIANGGDGTVTILLGDGTGHFTYGSAPGVGYGPGAVAVGDFNGDGKLDLAVTSCGGDPYCGSTGVVAILSGDGAGNFTLASSPPTGYYPQSVAVGDFNGDGKLDLAVASCGSDRFCGSPGAVSILLGDGTGNFTLASSPATGVDPWSVAVGDFNGDGNLDLAIANYHSNTVSILLGDGTGNFTLASSPATGDEPYSVAVGDFNGDSILDLVVDDVYNSNTVSVLLGDGTGDFTVAASPPIGGVPVAVAVGDFNSDGKLDVAAVNGSLPAVSVLLQSVPVATFSPPSLKFGMQLVGTASQPQNVTLTNSGAKPLEIGGITASANFSETNNCSSSVAVGASCTITVTFRPLGIGTFTGTVTITDNGFNSPQTVPLTGAGTMVGLSPSTVNFYTQTVGTTSAAQTVTMTNHGYRTVNVGFGLRGSNPGDFAQTNTCGNSLAAGASCTISVTFTPQAKGSRTATLNVVDNGGGSPQVVTLKGFGM